MDTPQTFISQKEINKYQNKMKILTEQIYVL